MKLLVPVKFYVRGGIERVMFSLLQEFDDLIDGVVVLLPEKSVTKFQENLPESDNIHYESFNWPEHSWGARSLKLLNYIGRLGKKLKLQGLHGWSEARIADLKLSARIREVAERHDCTHCLYFMGNRIQPPTGLKIPLALISYDLFWRFAPLTYAPELVEEYDDSLHQWLTVADLVIAISRKTRCDLLTVFPNFEHKVMAIPLASDRSPIPFLNSAQSVPRSQEKTTFFFPSSFSIYKDHLTLLRAAIALHRAGYDFQLVLTGKETDRLVSGSLQLSQQKNTQEYEQYVAQFQELYTDAEIAWKQIFVGLGYCSLEMVEATYESCQCVVVPSVYEGFGLAIAEAIVRGIPVIAADIEVFREQVELYRCPDRVRFFPPGNVDALFKCLAEFMENPVPRLTLTEATNRCDHWTWRQVAVAYLNALQSQVVSVPESAETSPSALDS